MTLTKKISNHNFKAFLWHAGFLAFAQNFMDVDTVIPAMVIESGGNAMHIDVLIISLLVFFFSKKPGTTKFFISM